MRLGMRKFDVDVDVRGIEKSEGMRKEAVLDTMTIHNSQFTITIQIPGIELT